jgi:protein tyrosine phosphatase
LGLAFSDQEEARVEMSSTSPRELKSPSILQQSFFSQAGPNEAEANGSESTEGDPKEGGQVENEEEAGVKEGGGQETKKMVSKYVNANWVDGARGQKYICTQAPLQETLFDFWLMIWQHSMWLLF